MNTLFYVLLFCFVCLASATYYNTTVAGSFGTIQGLSQTLPNASYPGNQSSNVVVNMFLGVPYAQPPVGSLRFTNSRPAAPFTSTFSATQYGNICPQVLNGAFQFPNPTLSEDCLNLNIYAPDTPGLKPVLFWMHAGAYVQGSGSELRYHGQHYSASQNIIVVTINYRLGAFGFLAHPSLLSESNTTGTYGLSDQAQALTWVINNIALFGGDNSRITVGGVSAGGASSLYLLANPAVNGYISKIITQSPDFLSQAQSLFEGLSQGQEVASLLACNGTDAQILSCLRNYSYNSYIFLQPFSLIAKATIDGQFLVDAPYNLITRNLLKRVPVLFGSTADEFSLFTYGSQTAPLAPLAYPGFIKLFLEAFIPASSAIEASRLYPCTTSDCRPAAISCLSDASLICQVNLFAEYYNQGNSSLFGYLWNHTSSFEKPELKAAHLSELPFAFNSLTEIGVNFTADEAVLGREMNQYWGNFINYGNPNGVNPSVWPVFTVQNGYQRIVFESSTPSVTSGFKASSVNPGCGYWINNIFARTTAQEVTLLVNNNASSVTASPSPVPSPVMCPSVSACPTMTASPSASPGCGSKGSNTGINFYFADILRQ